MSSPTPSTSWPAVDLTDRARRQKFGSALKRSDGVGRNSRALINLVTGSLP